MMDEKIKAIVEKFDKDLEKVRKGKLYRLTPIGEEVKEYLIS